MKKFFCDVGPLAHDDDGKVLVEGVERGGFHDGEGAAIEGLPEAMGVKAIAARANDELGRGDVFNVGVELFSLGKVNEGGVFKEGLDVGSFRKVGGGREVAIDKMRFGKVHAVYALDGLDVRRFPLPIF